MYNWIYSLSLTDSINIFHILFRDCAANCFWLLILGIFLTFTFLYFSPHLSISASFCPARPYSCSWRCHLPVTRSSGCFDTQTTSRRKAQTTSSTSMQTCTSTTFWLLVLLLFWFWSCVVFRRHIAELIFYMEELRAHVRKYGPVMQRYYVQYLSGFDAVVLNELVQVWTHTCTSDTSSKQIHSPPCLNLYGRIDLFDWYVCEGNILDFSWKTTISFSTLLLSFLTSFLSCLCLTEPVCVSRGRVYNHVFICQHNDLSQCQTR